MIISFYKIKQSTPRVKFAIDHQLHQNQSFNGQNNMAMKTPVNTLQRSKSLSSADAIARGIAGLGLALGNEATDIGQFTPEIQTIIDKANEDPNQLNARTLMDLATQLLQRSVDGRRYDLTFLL